MRIIILIFLLCLTFFSCKKKELTFQFKGTVSDLTFNKGLEGAVLTLEEVAANGSSNSTQIINTTIGADGAFDFTFKRNSAIKYKLKITKKDYFTISEDIPFSDFSTESPLVKNYSSYGKSWVKLRFVNQAPFLSSDLFRFVKQEGKEGCEECCPIYEREFLGIVDTTIYCINDGNTVYSYYYWSQNPNAAGLESITTIAFDTVEIVKYY
jgi:hypothetical protein